MVELSDSISPRVQVESLDEHLQMDVDMVNAHAEMVRQVAEEIQDCT